MSLFGFAATRLIAGALGAGAAMLIGASSAIADPSPAPAPPGCTAAELARVSGNVATATAAYLDGHPDVNDFFTSLKGLQSDDRRSQVQAYMDANPQVHAELRAIRQPLTDFQNRCEIAADPLIN